MQISRINDDTATDTFKKIFQAIYFYIISIFGAFTFFFVEINKEDTE